MDGRVPLIKTIFYNNIATQLQKFESRTNAKNGQLTSKCYSQSGKNADRFVSCLHDGTTKIKQIDEDLKLTLQFSQRIAHDCLDRGSSVQKCSGEATTFGKKMIQHALKQIKKI